MKSHSIKTDRTIWDITNQMFNTITKKTNIINVDTTQWLLEYRKHGEVLRNELQTYQIITKSNTYYVWYDEVNDILYFSMKG